MMNRPNQALNVDSHSVPETNLKLRSVGISEMLQPYSRSRVCAKLLSHYVLLIHRLPSLLLIPLVLLISLLRRWLLIIPPLWRPTLHRYVLPSAPVHLLLYVGSVLDVLVKLANVAIDFVPWLNGEWDDRYLII